ncbi:phage tail protein, partial [Terrisporobacter sp.]|uniref:phage tail protein n=1 Tax=Terrisporobacter sp. TaxID=1965305 RepID=UPI0026386146
MLKLYNKEHKAIGVLTNLKDYKIEYLLSGEDLTEFSLSICDENIHLVEEEGYVRNKNNEYVIKAIDPAQELKRYSCVVNIEDIKGKSIANFDTSNNNITETIRLAIAGTGWVLADNNISKRRTVRLKNTNALEVLREIRKVFRVDFRYDAINKIIYVYEQFGSDKGVYFSDELNLKSFSIPSDTYDYATRLYPYGKDGLNIASVNGGKEYIENFQYSNKIIELIWEDNRYTDVNSLKEDAEAKLDELSKPKRSYQADIVDLAKQSEEYSFLDFFLGDTITLLSKKEKFRDKQRIVKYIEYPKNPTQNTCELGNTQLTFEELQKENEAKNQVVDNITSDNGTLDGSKVDSITTEQISDFEAEVAKITDLTVINAEIANLKAENVTITGKLSAIEGEFGTLKANVGVIDKLTVTHTAQINDLKANSATITQLEAVSAKIGTVEAEVGKINTLLAGNITGENIQAGGITSDKLTIANGFITNAMIDSLDVSKINAGDISTSKFRIKSDDGGIEIVGATQQFKDKNNKVRVQIGKDSKGNFNFIIRGEDGQSVLIDHTGVKANAIADDLIVSGMIASDAVGEKQINYSSFATGFNKDTNTSTIKSTKIMLNNQNQTLEVAFNSLKTQADGTKSLTESHSTTIGVMQGQITTAINNTQIVKDGQTILLKDDYNRTVATVDSMKSTIGSHTTTINEHTGKITGVETRVNTVERDLNSITQRVSSTETKVTTVTNTANTANTNATNALNTANSANSKVDGLQVGGRNLILNSKTILLNGSDNGNRNCSTIENDCVKISPINNGNVYNTEVATSETKFKNKTYTISFDILTPTTIGFYWYPSENYSKGNYIQASDKWQRISFTYTQTGDDKKGAVLFGFWGLIGGNIYYYKNLKLEVGTKDTDWTPAPEDIQTQIDANKTEISSTKSKVSTIETNLNGITSRVSAVETNQTTTGNKVTSL